MKTEKKNCAEVATLKRRREIWSKCKLKFNSYYYYYYFLTVLYILRGVTLISMNIIFPTLNRQSSWQLQIIFFLLQDFFGFLNCCWADKKTALKRWAILCIFGVRANAISCPKRTEKLIRPQAQKLQACHVICSSTEILEAYLSAPPSSKKKIENGR